MPDVANHEPASALDGGDDGFGSYRSIIPDLPRLLTQNGVAVVELGAGQAPHVAELGRRSGLTGATKDDLAGVARALVLRNTQP
jgi:release factor glutamine methyltransferase